MLKSGTTREEFVLARTARDKTLQAPKLLLPSVQINIDAGRLPERHPNGRSYLSIPLNLFRAADETGAPSTLSAQLLRRARKICALCARCSRTCSVKRAGTDGARWATGDC